MARKHKTKSLGYKKPSLTEKNVQKLVAMLYGKPVRTQVTLPDGGKRGHCDLHPSHGASAMNFHKATVEDGEAGLGIIAHEVAHGLFTKVEYCGDRDTKEVKILADLLEEPRVEARMAREWRVSRDWLEASARKYLLNDVKPADVSPIMAAILFAGRVHGRTLTPTPAIKTAISMADHFPEAVWAPIYAAVDARGKASMIPYANQLRRALREAGLDIDGRPPKTEEPEPEPPFDGDGETSDEGSKSESKDKDKKDGSDSKSKDKDKDKPKDESKESSKSKDSEEGNSEDGDEAEGSEGSSDFEDSDDAESSEALDSECESGDESDGEEGDEDGSSASGSPMDGGMDGSLEGDSTESDDGEGEAGAHGKTGSSGDDFEGEPEPVDMLDEEWGDSLEAEEWKTEAADASYGGGEPEPYSLDTISEFVEDVKVSDLRIAKTAPPSEAAMELRRKVGSWLMKTSERARVMRLGDHPKSSKSRMNVRAKIASKLTGVDLPSWRNQAVGTGQKAPDVVIVSDFSGSMAYAIHGCAEITWALTWAAIDARCDRTAGYWMGDTCTPYVPTLDVSIPYASAGTETLQDLPPIDPDTVLIIISDFILVNHIAVKKMAELVRTMPNLYLFNVRPDNAYKLYYNAEVFDLMAARMVTFTGVEGLLETGPWAMGDVIR